MRGGLYIHGILVLVVEPVVAGNVRLVADYGTTDGTRLSVDVFLK